jgi:hypothetical protein
VPPDPTAPDNAAVADDVCTLPHEGGHLVSWEQSGTTSGWLAYEQAAIDYQRRDCVTHEEHALILDEEETAWKLGREKLRSLGITDWTYFEERRRKRLAKYRALTICPEGSEASNAS